MVFPSSCSVFPCLLQYRPNATCIQWHPLFTWSLRCYFQTQNRTCQCVKDIRASFVPLFAAIKYKGLYSFRMAGILLFRIQRDNSHKGTYSPKTSYYTKIKANSLGCHVGTICCRKSVIMQVKWYLVAWCSCQVSWKSVYWSEVINCCLSRKSEFRRLVLLPGDS